MRSEEEVRETVGDLNRRILEWRRIPEGPPIFVRLVNKDEMVSRWRAAQAAKRPQPSPRPPGEPAPETPPRPAALAAPARPRHGIMIAAGGRIIRAGVLPPSF